MTAIKKSSILLCFATLLIIACAKPVNPSGGPKDTEAPKLDTLQSDPNLKTNFTGNTIHLKFDEFVTITNTSKEVIISPPTLYFPKFNQKGKDLTIEFDEREVLKENATYQINFGNSIKDLNESNKLENFSYVFSTGDKIDSLSVRGKIIDDFTGEAEKDMLVMLYDQLDDSIVYRERPLYFARTDDNGNFEINNLRADTFKVFGLQDANVNYYYDNPIEKIAFLDSTIILPLADSVEIILSAFVEQTEQKIISLDSKTPGLIKAVLNIPKEDIAIHISNDTLETQTFTWNDSLYIYYKPVPDSAFFLHAINDTFRIAPRKPKARSLRLVKTEPSINTPIFPKSEVLISFNEPIGSIVDSLIRLKDSTQIYPIDISVVEGKLQLALDQPDSSIYSLEILPGAVSNFQLTLEDSLEYEIIMGLQEDFGNIIIEGKNLKEDYNYIFQLQQQSNTILELQIQKDSTGQVEFNNLIAGDYILTVIEDRNKNGRWDPGSYSKNLKSEKILTTPLEKLRKSWDLNIAFDGTTFTNN